MERTVLRYAPDYWEKNYLMLRTEYPLNKYDEEYKQLEFEIKKATRNNNLNIKSIKRNQNIHDYGQLILREQLLAVSDPHQSYYRVRRYISLQSHYLNTALEYNIDPRRCGLARLRFNKYINCSYSEVILVVQVVTADPNADIIEPKNSTEYFIDYVVELI